MNNPPILVNGKPFFGRKEEQREFKSQIERAIRPPRDEANDPAPFIMYLYGDGGMGKTTLLRRFWDIVSKEFSNHFHMTWVDWEEERDKTTMLKGDRSLIRATTVLDRLYLALVAHHPDWEEALKPYQMALEKREEVRHTVEQMFIAPDEHDPLSALRGTSATVLAKFLRSSAENVGVMVGDEGETLISVIAEIGLQQGESAARKLAGLAESRIRTRLNAEEVQLLLSPDEALATSFGKALKVLSEKRGLLGNSKRLVFFMDTYEIVSASDRWVRIVMKTAGAKTVWVFAGRDNLAESRLSKGRFLGYSQAFPTRFRPFDMRKMAPEDVQDYFAATVPQFPLEGQYLDAIYNATHAIPLVVREAAAIWQKVNPKQNAKDVVDLIVRDIADNITNEDLVATMTERYLYHCADLPEDRYALFALAFANGDAELLYALLVPNDDPQWNLEDRLVELERGYASVHRLKARLHEDAATFFLDYLREPIRHADPRRNELIKRGINHLETRLQEVESTLRLIEERHQDETWRDTTLRLTDLYFWKDEQAGWKWFAPRYVESIVYSSAMRSGLIEVAKRWKLWLKQGVKRLESISEPPTGSQIVTENENIEIERWHHARWLDGEECEERLAILGYLRARTKTHQKSYSEALQIYHSLRGLPEGGILLRRKMAEGLHDICNRLLFPDGKRDAVSNPEAIRAGALALQIDPTYTDILYTYAITLALAKRPVEALEQLHSYAIHQGELSATYWNTIGNVYGALKQYPEAIAAFQAAIRIDPADANPHTGLGNVYGDLKQYPEAIAAYQAAIRIDPAYAYPHNGLGNVYSDLKQYPEAIAAFQAAIRIDPAFAYPHNGLGNVYSDLKQYFEAIAAFQAAIRIDPAFAYPHNGLGNVYRDLKQYPEAIAAYQAAIRIDPAFAYPHNGLGIVYRRQGKYGEAILAYHQALQRAPNDLDIWNNLAMACSFARHFHEAIMAWGKVIEISPDRADAHACLANAFRNIRALERYEHHITLARTLMQYSSSYNQACVEAIAENSEHALILLELSFQDGSGDKEWAKEDPDLDSLRDDPRFRALVGLDNPME